jgi:hypothetical protein
MVTPTMTRRLPDEALNFFRAHGARGGKIAGRTMTPAERKARATKASRAAALARTKKKHAKKTTGK